MVHDCALPVDSAAQRAEDRLLELLGRHLGPSIAHDDEVLRRPKSSLLSKTAPRAVPAALRGVRPLEPAKTNRMHPHRNVNVRGCGARRPPASFPHLWESTLVEKGEESWVDLLLRKVSGRADNLSRGAASGGTAADHLGAKGGIRGQTVKARTALAFALSFTLVLSTMPSSDSSPVQSGVGVRGEGGAFRAKIGQRGRARTFSGVDGGCIDNSSAADGSPCRVGLVLRRDTHLQSGLWDAYASPNGGAACSTLRPRAVPAGWARKQTRDDRLQHCQKQR